VAVMLRGYFWLCTSAYTFDTRAIASCLVGHMVCRS